MAAQGPGGEPPSPPVPPSSSAASKAGAGGSSRRGSVGVEGDGRGGRDGTSRKGIEKEFERTEKWMRMMGVKRKVGGNAVEWVWKGEGTSKVCPAHHGTLR